MSDHFDNRDVFLSPLLHTNIPAVLCIVVFTVFQLSTSLANILKMHQEVSLSVNQEFKHIVKTSLEN